MGVMWIVWVGVIICVNSYIWIMVGRSLCLVDRLMDCGMRYVNCLFI